MNVWKKVHHATSQAFFKASLPSSDTAALISISAAAIFAAEKVYKIHKDYFRQLGKVTFERAIPFVRVFALAMTSRWILHMSRNDQSLDRIEMWAYLATAVLKVFGDDSEERYEEAWLLDIQFNHDYTILENQHKPLAYSNEQWLLLCLAARSLDAPFTWKLSSPPIPFSSGSELHNPACGWDPPAGLNLLDIARLMEVQNCLLAAEAGMGRAFRAIQQYRQERQE